VDEDKTEVAESIHRSWLPIYEPPSRKKSRDQGAQEGCKGWEGSSEQECRTSESVTGNSYRETIQVLVCSWKSDAMYVVMLGALMVVMFYLDAQGR